MEQIRHYDAFISYRHLEWDSAVAEKLQNLLEKRKICIESNGRKKRALRIFRDQSELPTSDNLGKDIRTALDNSDYLIVICSRSYKDSKWCMEEIRHFRALHNNTNKNILPLLIEGEPAESFPELLFWEETCSLEMNTNAQKEKKEIEPLAADIRAADLKTALKKLKTKEYLRIAAPILGVSFDELYQRKRRAQKRAVITALSGTAALFFSFGIYNWYMLRQISDRQSKILENESVRLADSAELQMNNHDYTLALLLANEAYNFHEESGTEGAHSKAETALRSAVFGRNFESNAQPLSVRAVIPFNTSNWEIIKSLNGGNLLQVCDGGSTYLYDTVSGELRYTFAGQNYIFNNNADLCVLLNRLNEYEVMFQGIYVKTGSVYFEYTMACRPASFIDAYYDDETNACYFDIDGGIEAYADANGEISSCFMRDSDADSLPESVWKNIIERGHYQSYQENCDIDYDGMDIHELSECSEAERKALDSMKTRGYTEIQLTKYDHDYIFISGRLEETGDTYQTLIFSNESGEYIYTLAGRYLIDRNNGCLYQRQKNQLLICQLNMDNIKQNKLKDNTVLCRISNTGKRCCLVNNQLGEEEQAYSGYAQVKVFDIKKMNKALFDEYVKMDIPGEGEYQLNADMSKIIYEDTHKTVRICEIGGALIQTIPFDVDDYIYAVALNDSGNMAAIAYYNGADHIALYDTSNSRQIMTIDYDDFRRGYSSIGHMEIRNDILLVADLYNVYLFDLQNSKFPSKCFDGAVRKSHFQRFLTEDGLLLCTVSGYFDADGLLSYYLDKIYDIDSEECILDVKMGAYDYDASTGFLVYQPYTEYGYAPITIMQRQEDGHFQEVWNIKSDNVDMQLLHNQMSLDGNLLLLSGKDTCEVYDLSTQDKIMETGFPDLFIKNQTLYYLGINSDNELMHWTLMEDMQTIQNRAVELLDGRTFSEEERSRYYILNK